MRLFSWAFVAATVGYLSGCAGVPPAKYAYTSGWQSPMSGTVAVLPIDFFVREADQIELNDDHRAEIQMIIRSVASAHGLRVVDRGVGEAWQRALNEVGGMFDPVTGRVDKLKTQRIASRVLQRLEADYLVTPKLLYTLAELTGSSARWDGVRRSVHGLDRASESVVGTTHAISLELAVFARDGERYSSQAGLIYPYRFITPRRPMRFDPEPMMDRKQHIFEGVQLAFEPILPQRSS
ncbi:MAG: hypothetical protein ACFB9M_13390 [Myxococcota bacterium]